MIRSSKTASLRSFLIFASAALFWWTPSAHAVLLNAGDTLLLPGTTALAEPQLAGLALVDEIVPFSITTVGGPITGSVQQTVLRSSVDNTLDFYWRVFNDANSVGPIAGFRLGDFVSSEYNANWRIDGLGDVGPAHAHRFDVPKESFVNFLFDAPSAGPPGVLPGQSSKYFFLDTTATSYNKTAIYDLTGTGTVGISDSFPTYTPGIPEPASVVLVLIGFAAFSIAKPWTRKVAAAVAVIAICACTQAHATTYTSDTALSDFTTGVTFATFSNRAALSGDLPGDTPTETTVDHGNRVYGNNDSPPVLAAFPAPTANIRVFANIDHFGAAFDGYQYTIAGSNDGVSYSPLFDALTVDGAGEPFTLGTFTGTAPTNVNNVLIGTGGGEGITGYIADFSFPGAYQYYSFGASTIAIVSGNADQELSAVGSFVAEPATSALMLVGLAILGVTARRRPEHCKIE